MVSPTDRPPLSWRLAVTVPAAAAGGDADTNSSNNNAGPSPSPSPSPPHQEHFLCSTDPALIQLDALHQAMSSDLLWWAKPLEPDYLAAMVANSVCLGVYRVSGEGEEEEERAPEMVGFARLATDRVTFAYLTDVYVLPAYQRRGLGHWLMRCLREMVEGDGAGNPGWPTLRCLWLIASTPAAARMYVAALGAEDVARYRAKPGEPDSGMILLELMGPSSGLRNAATT